MRQRRPGSRSVSPGHFLILVQIGTLRSTLARSSHAPLRAPRFPAPARVQRHLWWWRLRIASVGRALLPVMPRRLAKRANCPVCSSAPLAHAASREQVLTSTVQRCPCSPASVATTVPHGGVQRHPHPPLHRTLPPPLRHSLAFSAQAPPRRPPSWSPRHFLVLVQICTLRSTRARSSHAPLRAPRFPAPARVQRHLW